VPTGSDKRVVRINPNATLDFDGKSGSGYPETLFVLAGGSIVNNGKAIGNSGKGEWGGVPHLVNLKLEADSTIGGNTMPVLAMSYATTYLDMGGHKLTVAMNANNRLYLCSTQVSGGGTIEVTGGYLVIGGYTGAGDIPGGSKDISMPTTSLVQSGTGGVRLQKNLEVLDYTCRATANWSQLSGTLTVNGTMLVSNEVDLAFSMPIKGAPAFVKQGAGALNVSGWGKTEYTFSTLTVAAGSSITGAVENVIAVTGDARIPAQWDFPGTLNLGGALTIDGTAEPAAGTTPVLCGTLAFAEETEVSVDLRGRKLSGGKSVLTWTTRPTNATKFVLVPELARDGWGLAEKDNTLYLETRGFMIIVQ